MPTGNAEIIDNLRAFFSQAKSTPANVYAKSAPCAFILIYMD